MNTMINEIEKLELSLMAAMLKDIAGTNDPVEQFRAIERYDKFVSAYATRVDSTYYNLRMNENASSTRKIKS